ncbi:MAG: hypothetical protein ABI288_06800 [Ginsengibacter sp.]
MKNNIMQSGFVACILVVFTGCTHYYYAPNAANIPLFKEKNTLKINGGFSGGDNYQGGDVQLAYSLSPKIGIMFNSFFAGNTDEVDVNGNPHTETGRGSLFEIGAGYYKPFGAKNRWTFETYAGAGIGSEKHTYQSNQKANLGLIRYFIQPSIGYSSSNGFLEVALGSRFCDLNLKLKDLNVSPDKEDLDNIVSHPSSILWEPTLKLAMGWETFKFYLQITSSNNLTNTYLPQDHTNINFGIQLTLK